MNHDKQDGGPREEKARRGSRNEKAVANSDKGGGQSTGVTLSQEAPRAQTVRATDFTRRPPPPISNNGRFCGAKAAKGFGPYHDSDQGRARLTQELEGWVVTEAGVSGTPDGALSESLSR